ncbi:DUF362 domain-containing protein [Natrarchaeobius chitinivorans]|uniref:DUF362 domain-containing protein n=1 Tax=Natrarchaeobius chitinivorans TaxID=1679083 RepID=A0A3N6M4Z6_NATCH|nr:DUF362 domain-containing protein [Natrarchaeobius chitinivorans]RQG97107.1 DUF362 domain-containing protein [Natrarchaeobius chitinivorans]
MTEEPVRGAIVGENGRDGNWNPDIDSRMAAFESPIEAVLGPALESLPNEERIAIVPDVHYPFHPSTGMVTDPALVGTIVSTLESHLDADVDVVAETDGIDVDRAATYLGYPSLLERFGAEFVGLDDGDARTTELCDIDGRSVSVSVPTRLLERTVVVVPTLRPTESKTVAGGMRTLAATAESTADPAATTVASTTVLDPFLSVLDATIAYGGEPHAANAVFSGPVSPVDALAGSLLGCPTEKDRALSLALEDRDDPISIERVGRGRHHLDLDALRERLSGGELPPSGATHPAVTTAYRLYAAIGRDAVPPQLEEGR